MNRHSALMDRHHQRDYEERVRLTNENQLLKLQNDRIIDLYTEAVTEITALQEQLDKCMGMHEKELEGCSGELGPFGQDLVKRHKRH